jgi:hypothetical protein
MVIVQDGSGNFEITYVDINAKELRKRTVNADVAYLLQNALWFGKQLAKRELQAWLNDGKELPR